MGESTPVGSTPGSPLLGPAAEGSKPVAVYGGQVWTWQHKLLAGVGIGLALATLAYYFSLLPQAIHSHQLDIHSFSLIGVAQGAGIVAIAYQFRPRAVELPAYEIEHTGQRIVGEQLEPPAPGSQELQDQTAGPQPLEDRPAFWSPADADVEKWLQQTGASPGLHNAETYVRVLGTLQSLQTDGQAIPAWLAQAAGDQYQIARQRVELLEATLAGDLMGASSPTERRDVLKALVKENEQLAAPAQELIGWDVATTMFPSA
jgi:hypothetical protein